MISKLHQHWKTISARVDTDSVSVEQEEEEKHHSVQVVNRQLGEVKRAISQQGFMQGGAMSALSALEKKIEGELEYSTENAADPNAVPINPEQAVELNLARPPDAQRDDDEVSSANYRYHPKQVADIQKSALEQSHSPSHRGEHAFRRVGKGQEEIPVSKFTTKMAHRASSGDLHDLVSNPVARRLSMLSSTTPSSSDSSPTTSNPVTPVSGISPLTTFPPSPNSPPQAPPGSASAANANAARPPAVPPRGPAGPGVSAIPQPTPAGSSSQGSGAAPMQGVQSSAPLHPVVQKPLGPASLAANGSSFQTPQQQSSVGAASNSKKGKNTVATSQPQTAVRQ